MRSVPKVSSIHRVELKIRIGLRHPMSSPKESPAVLETPLRFAPFAFNKVRREKEKSRQYIMKRNTEGRRLVASDGPNER